MVEEKDGGVGKHRVTHVVFTRLWSGNRMFNFMNYEVPEEGTSRIEQGGWFCRGGHKRKSLFHSKSSNEYAVTWHSKTTVHDSHSH